MIGLTICAALAALYGGKEIFSRVLPGWAAMDAAFGPLLLVRVVMGRTLAAPRIFATMVTGFVLSALADRFHADVPLLREYTGIMKYVLPWLAAFAIAYLGSGGISGRVSGPGGNV